MTHAEIGGVQTRTPRRREKIIRSSRSSNPKARRQRANVPPCVVNVSRCDKDAANFGVKHAGFNEARTGHFDTSPAFRWGSRHPGVFLVHRGHVIQPFIRQVLQ